MIDTILEGNRRFRETEFCANIDHYREIARVQKPKALFITCADSRIQTASITGTRVGDLFVMRNVGNIVPPQDHNAETVLTFAISRLNIPLIVVCGHSGCASIRSLDQEFDGGAISRWLEHAREARERVDDHIDPPRTDAERAGRYRRIEQENVRLQVEHVLTYPLVRKARRDRRVTVQGMYYDLATGELSLVD